MSKDVDKKTEAQDGIWETVKVIFQALIIAFVIRMFFFQPFNIPSGSMIPTLRIGDYLFVNKLSYGYGPYSFNFTAGIFGNELFSVSKVPIKGRIFASMPERGDVMVFKTPTDNKTDFIKRIIGLPGDHIQVVHGVLIINGKAVKRVRIADYVDPKGQGHGRPIQQFRETLPNGVSYNTLNLTDFSPGDNTREYVVPEGRLFMMGDNRDNSSDSRILSHVGYVPIENLVGKATFIFYSHGPDASIWKFWRWPFDIRWSRLFKWVQG